MKSIEARLASNPFIVGAAKGNVVSKAGIERRNKLEVEVDGESKPMGAMGQIRRGGKQERPLKMP